MSPNPRRGRHAALWCATAAALTAPAVAQDPGAEEPITTESLLREMIDRTSVARWPEPVYTTRQFSSYDRASTAPGDESWWANQDRGHFLRVEERDGRTEHVLMDADGPGAIVRFWSANPPEGGTLRLYLDGAETPALEAPITAVLRGGLAKPPLSDVLARGWNLFVPIPYASHILVTCDVGDFYYQINYRTYAEGTPVTSFSTDRLRAASRALGQAQRALRAHRMPLRQDTNYPLSGAIAPGETISLDLRRGPASVRQLMLNVQADDLTAALRTTVIRIEFDGTETVWCPVGDFFGAGIGLNRFAGWWRTVAMGETEREGNLACHWVMPYDDGARITLDNFGDQAVTIGLRPIVGPWSWDDCSMYFHTTWRQQNPIATLPRLDWNYLEVEGRGVFVGDTLAVVNPVEAWWGEGDEKLYVDGETFPSHFGTGTEDYYGYAWCSPDIFAAPFHAQPRCDGPGNYGHTTVSRTRGLDAIPFERSFRFDMEVWHWKDCAVGYAATSHFYARPGATHNRPPAPEEVARGVLDPPPLPPPYRIPGAIEVEGLKGRRASGEFPAAPQRYPTPRLWSNDEHLWVQAQAVGDFVDLAIPVEGDAPRRVTLYATRSWDYAIVRFSVNGEPAGPDVDLFNRDGRAVVSTGPIDLGVWTPANGHLLVRAEVVGSNPGSEAPATFFGLDCVVLDEP